MYRLLLAAMLVPTFVSAGAIPLAPEPEVSTSTIRARRSTSSSSNLGIEDQRMNHRFGLGVTAGGPLGVFGVEADVHVNEWLSASVGYGTGIEFSTWSTKMRAVLPGQWVAPYFGVGFGRWWTDGTPERRPGPSLLADRLLSKDEDPTKGFSAYLLYPNIGVDWALPSGFTFSFELDCLLRLFSLRYAFYGGAAARWYF